MRGFWRSAGLAARIAGERSDLWIPGALASVAFLGWLPFVGAVVPLRAVSIEEGLGMDVSQHGEEAYAEGEGAILVLPERESPLGAAAMVAEGGRA